MTAAYERHQIDWHGIAVSVEICPDYSSSYREECGYPLVHIVLRADGPLPFSETGFRSHFISSLLTEAYGGPLAYVEAWLGGYPPPARQLSLL